MCQKVTRTSLHTNNSNPWILKFGEVLRCIWSAAVQKDVLMTFGDVSAPGGVEMMGIYLFKDKALY